MKISLVVKDLNTMFIALFSLSFLELAPHSSRGGVLLHAGLVQGKLLLSIKLCSHAFTALRIARLQAQIYRDATHESPMGMNLMEHFLLLANRCDHALNLISEDEIGVSLSD